ncbi:MAG: peroxide stress protein YaaA [Actinomycetota bacterium]|jgi:cytoplasmic iron level regulating protein YaaA (DUF328/UPF0246 family)
MRFLLPPSETKVSGGTGAILNLDSLSFKGLGNARAQVLSALDLLAADPIQAAKVLKLGPKQLTELAANEQLRTSQTLPALERYDGTLFDALKGIEPAVAGGAINPLSQLAQSRLAEHVFIQSALLGLVSAGDEIPAYRLSGTTALPGVSLKKLWPEAHAQVWLEVAGVRQAAQGRQLASAENPPHMLIDLRSKTYADLAPLPTDGSIEWVWVEVVHEGPDGARKPMNHFNKKAKGVLVRAALQAKTLPKTLAELAKVARTVGLELEMPTGDRTAVLVTREQVNR